jgi:DNA-directed RNA polymerase specialized sigma24 family protein
MEASNENSVSEWLSALKAEDSIAAERLWERYIEKLARLARRKLGVVPRRAADEDDVAAEVFADFLQGVQERRFERLKDRNDLWQILAMLTERNAIGFVRREMAAKRGRGRVHGESAFIKGAAEATSSPGIGQIAGREPTPEFAIEMADTLNHYFQLLDNENLRALARDNLAGYTQAEIAKRHRISIPTVQRKLKLIRAKWQRELRP